MMSPTSLRVLKGQIQRGVAGLDTIDVWEQKRTITPEEAVEARAYWHQLYDPPPPPEPEPVPAAEPETPVAGETSSPEEPASDG
jgi:hypothetical protein